MPAMVIDWRSPQESIAEMWNTRVGLPARSLDPVVVLRGGTELTPEQCKAALDEAMTIIEAVGTTGIYTQYQKAHQWMNRYYPAWA